MISFWEQQSFLRSDIVIIGGGILGLSVACSIKEHDSKSSVTVLERGVLPTGASTKNAGFACFGSLTELLADERTLGKEKMLSLVEKRWKGLQKLRARLGDDAIDFRQHGGYELLTESELFALGHLERMNAVLFPVFNENIFSLADEKIETFGFASGTVRSLVFTSLEGQIDTGKMILALMQKAQSLGVMIFTGANVTAIHPHNDSVDIEIDSAEKKILMNAHRVGICTNAFLSDLLPAMNVVPGRGQIVATKPISGLKFRGTFHFDHGFYYFRDFNNRIIFGGGRNQDFDAEATSEFAPNEKILFDLKKKLSEVILPHTPFEIEMSWQGIMGFGESKIPFIKEVHPNLFAALGCNGMGIALSSLLGEELAERILQ
ncbi:MAG: FAD-binding oxidoreductase [Ignavibacteriales bacterium]|nr:FAD-binding oxidoreductase [Ignavibacteriales bacterium]